MNHQCRAIKTVLLCPIPHRFMNARKQFPITIGVFEKRMVVCDRVEPFKACGVRMDSGKVIYECWRHPAQQLSLF